MIFIFDAESLHAAIYHVWGWQVRGSAPRPAFARGSGSQSGTGKTNGVGGERGGSRPSPTGAASGSLDFSHRASIHSRCRAGARVHARCAPALAGSKSISVIESTCARIDRTAANRPRHLGGRVLVSQNTRRPLGIQNPIRISGRNRCTPVRSYPTKTGRYSRPRRLARVH